MWPHIRGITQSENLGTEGEILQPLSKLKSTMATLICAVRSQNGGSLGGEGGGIRELLELPVFPLSCTFKTHGLYCVCVMLQYFFIFKRKATRWPAGEFVRSKAGRAPCRRQQALRLLSLPQEPGKPSPSRLCKAGLVGAIPNQLGPHPTSPSGCAGDSRSSPALENRIGGNQGRHGGAPWEGWG